MNAAKTISEMAALVRLGDDPETAARILDTIAEQVARLEDEHTELIKQAPRLSHLLAIDVLRFLEDIDKDLPDRVKAHLDQ